MGMMINDFWCFFGFILEFQMEKSGSSIFMHLKSSKNIILDFDIIYLENVVLEQQYVMNGMQRWLYLQSDVFCKIHW